MNTIDMVEKHPLELFYFLQSRVELFNQQAVTSDDDIVNSLPPIGEPKLLGRFLSF